MENYFERKIKVIQLDWGGEYQKCSNIFEQAGIVYHISFSHTHEQNGSSERIHRHIVETVLTLLSHASLPLHFWDDAFSTAVYLINRMPTPILRHISPYEKLYQRISDYNSLKVFGCAFYPTSLLLDHLNVSFWDIVQITKATNAFMFQLVVHISLDM